MLRTIACLLLAIGAQSAWAQTAPSLGQVPKLLKTPEGKRIFAEQMEGKPAPDGLGVHLPAGLSARAIAALLLPAGGAAPLNTVGAKPLPGQADRYVAIVCTGGDLPTRPEDGRCARGYGDPKPALQVYLGVIEAKPGQAPRLIAKPVAVDGLVAWADTGLPSAPQALGDAEGGEIRPDSFDRFDLAPYRIAPSRQAFGLRASWSEGYSGGMAYYTALYLFAVVDGALRRILAIPMSSYADFGGDWHKDGTRSHDINEGANVLIVATHGTNGHFDLLLKARAGAWHRLYRWSDASGGYRPFGK